MSQNKNKKLYNQKDKQRKSSNKIKCCQGLISNLNNDEQLATLVSCPIVLLVEQICLACMEMTKQIFKSNNSKTTYLLNLHKQFSPSSI